jgi:hypothetical protein
MAATLAGSAGSGMVVGLNFNPVSSAAAPSIASPPVCLDSTAAYWNAATNDAGARLLANAIEIAFNIPAVAPEPVPEPEPVPVSRRLLSILRWFV